MKHPLKIAALMSAVVLFAACGPREEAAKPIVFSLQQTSRSATAEAALDSKADQKMAGDMMMVPVSTTYVAVGDLPALDGKAQSWKSDSAPTKKEMRRIADALGVEGDLAKQSDDLGGGYVVGPTDGSAPVVSFSNGTYDAFHSWWYSPKMEMSVTSTDPAAPDTAVSSDDAPVSSDVKVSEDPIREPEKPKNLPSKDETRALVEDIAQRAGFAIDEVEVQTDDWGVWATAWETFDGMRSPFTWNFGFGADSELTYAYGHLLDFADATSFPRVGTTVGVERLSNPKYSGWYGYGAVARDASVAIEPAPTMNEPIDGGSETKEAALPEPEVVEVTLTGVKESLMSVVDADGAVWLLPAYEYATADGYSVSTLAITDEFIVQEEQPSTDTVVDGGGTDSSPGSSGSGGSIEIVPPTESDAAELVGLSEDEAVKVIASRGWTSRVGSRDGEDFMLTTDYSETRLTLSIEEGAVTNAAIG
jgi:hypothetical protein